MQNYNGSGRGTSVPPDPARQSHQPPIPRYSQMNNPQGPLPQMFGPPMNNGYPPINPPPHMHRPPSAQGNPPGVGGSLPAGAQYPPAPYGVPPMPHSMPGALGVRSREWDASRDGLSSERDKKRPRSSNSAGPQVPPFAPGSTQNISGSFGNTSASQHSAGPFQSPNMQFPPMQGKGGTPNFPPIHQPSIPFQQRPNIAAPHGMPMGHPVHGVVPQPSFGSYPAKGTSTFGRQPPNIHPAIPEDRNQSSKGAQSSDDRSPRTPGTNQEPESFKEFLARQPDTISPQVAKELYDKYVRDFAKKRPSTFFDLHKHEEWFKERYDPDYVHSRCSRIQMECQDRAKDYRKLWDLGGSTVCAPDISSASRGGDGFAFDHEAGAKDDNELSADEKEVKFSTVTKDESEEVKNEEIKSEAKSEEVKHEGIKSEKLTTENKFEETKSEEGKSEEGLVEETQPEEGKSEEGVVEEDKSEEGMLIEEKMHEKGKTEDAKSAEVKSEEVKSEEVKSEEVKSEEVKSEEVKSEEVKSEEVKSEEVKSEEVKHEEVKSDDRMMDGNDIKETERKEELRNELDEHKADSNDGRKEEVHKEGAFHSDLKGNPESNEKKIIENMNRNTTKYANLTLPLRREHERHTIFLRGIPINLKREDLTAILAHGEKGDLDLQLRRVKIGDINPHRHLQRFAWAVYADEESASRALSIVKGVPVKPEKSKKDDLVSQQTKDEKEGASEYIIDCMLNLERKKKYSHGRILPEVFGTADRMKVDVEQSTKIMRFLDSLRKVDPEVNPLTDDFLASLPTDGRRLDHILTYLRETHYYCYYSGNEFLEDATSMPPQELRPVLADDEFNSDMDMRMAKRVDERTRWVLERDYDRPRSNSDNAEGAKKEALKSWLNANTVNEGEGRYRCNLPPNKLFKAPEFVHKHLKSRHADRMKEVLEKAVEDVYRANFENDPSKEEVISIYNEGAAGDKGPPNRGSRPPPPNSRDSSFGSNNNMAQARPTMPVGMFNPANYMGLGMQAMPMMMMPQAGFSYPNSMPFGRGMNASGMGPRMGSDMGRGGAMHHAGRKDEAGNFGGGSHIWRRPGGRGDGFGKEGRDGAYHESGPGAGLRGSHPHRGSRRGGPRRGGGRFDSHGEPLDPRAMGPRRNYTDLDAPAKGPSFDIVRYEDI